MTIKLRVKPKPWFEKVKEWWDALPFYQKTILVVAVLSGGAVGGYEVYKEVRKK